MCIQRPLLVAAVLCAAPLSAQDVPATNRQDRAPSPRRFLPVDYNVTARVNVEQLIDSRLFAAVERSFGGMVLRRFEEQFGFAFEQLDELHWAMREDYPPQDEVTPGGWPRVETRQTLVLRGTEEVDVSKSGDFPDRVDVDPTVFAGLRGYRQDDRVWLQLGEGLIVACEVDRAAAVLRDDAPGGVPVPQLTALTAGRPPLAVMAGKLAPAYVLERRGMDPIPSEWLDMEDPPRGVSLRLDEDGEGMHLVGRLRFGSDGPAREHFQRELEQKLAELRGNPRLRSLHDVLDGIEIRGDHRDVVAELHLDPDGAEVLALAQFMMLGWSRTAEPPQPQAAGAPAAAPVPVRVVEEVQEIEEAEEDPPQGGGKGKGKGKEQGGGDGR